MRKSSSSFRGRSIDFRGSQSTTVVEPAAGSGRHPEDRDAGVEEDARGRAEPHWHQQRGRPKDCHGGGGAEGGNEDFQLSKTVPSIILASNPPWQGFIFAALPWEYLRLKTFLGLNLMGSGGC